MDPKIAETIEHLPDFLAAQTDDDLSTYLDDVLKPAIAEAAEARNIEDLEKLTEALEAVRSEQKGRAEKSAADDAKIAELLAKVDEPTAEDPPAGDGEDGDGEEADPSDGEPAEGDDASTDEPAADPEPTAEQPDKIAASVRKPKLPTVDAMARLRPKTAKPQTSTDRGRVKVTAAGDVPGFGNGEEIVTKADLARAVQARWQNLRHSAPVTGRQLYTVASMSAEIPEERKLGSDPWENMEKIEAVVGMEALVASGGFCAPFEARYEMFTLGQADRPVRDALPRFGANRGGIRFISPFSALNFTDAVDAQTEADDIAGTDKTQKIVGCGTEDDAQVQAITKIMRFGNLNDRTHPEAIRHALDLAAIAHARRAEKELIDAIDTESTAVTTTTEYLSATRDILFNVARAAVAYRNRHRMDPDAILRWIAPAWIRDLIVVDLAQQAPGDDAIGRAKSEVTGYLGSINISPIWEQDNDTYVAQGVGLLLPFKSTFESFLFAEGTFLFLDGGTLDLGIVRDSTLNLDNNFQTFMETFEGVAKVGVESLKLTLDVCANGLAAGHDDSPRNCVGS